MPNVLFTDADIPPAPPRGQGVLLDVLATQLMDMGISPGESRDRAPHFVAAIYQAGLELGDRGRIADFKAALADWLKLAADNKAGGEESVDFGELEKRTRQLIGGKS